MKKIFLLLVAAAALTSCEEFLSKTPVSDLSPDNYFNDVSEMANWNAGIYDAFQSALSKMQCLSGDVRSDNCNTTGYENKALYMNAIDSQNSDASWQNFYQVITRANTGIAMYPSIPNVLESEYAPYMGQCYALRAMMYFYGTRIWGKLPIVTEVWDGNLENAYIQRSSLEEVRDQIYSDIEKAIQYFTISNTSSKYYASLAFARALKVEADMWYNKYQEAIDDSEYFMTQTTYKLAANESEWKKIFEDPENSNEVIFSMFWSYEEDGANTGWPGQLGATNTNNGNQISQSLFETLIDRIDRDPVTGAVLSGDARLWNTVDTCKLFVNNSYMPIDYAAYTASGIQKCIKYAPELATKEYDATHLTNKAQWDVLNTTNCEQKLCFERLANIYLLRAEALNQVGRGDEALALVNKIRSRVGYTKDAASEVSSSNKDDVEQLILLERQIEFYGEGQRWFDLMRTGHLIEVMDPVYRSRQEAAGVTVTGFGDEGTKYWPIYYKEFESNLALSGDQNPPYNER